MNVEITEEKKKIENWSKELQIFTIKSHRFDSSPLTAATGGG